ncbi:MAG: hypothetical protein ABIU06_11370 [Anaerolineales bacterium]
MLEIEASASNGKFSGVTKTYIEADGKRLINLGQMLLNFPQDVEQKVVCEFGADENYLKSVDETKKRFPKVLAHLSYISLAFRCRDNTDYTVAEITLQEGIDEDMKEGIKAKVHMEMPFDPAYITDFGKELVSMGEKKEGHAVLRGHPE